VKLADGSSVLADALSFGGDNIDVFAGVDGPYLVDSNADGVITSADTPNAAARGFSLEDGRFALAIMTPRGTAPAGDTTPASLWGDRTAAAGGSTAAADRSGATCCGSFEGQLGRQSPRRVE
jgi:hypothetical protein